MKQSIARFEIEPAAGMLPSAFTAADAFTTAENSETNHYYHATDDESMLAGVWECSPCKEVFEAYPVNEMMTVVSGVVKVTNDESGEVETFKAGDTFFIAKGARCTWEITETLRKFYFISS